MLISGDASRTDGMGKPESASEPTPLTGSSRFEYYLTERTRQRSVLATANPAVIDRLVVAEAMTTSWLHMNIYATNQPHPCL